MRSALRFLTLSLLAIAASAAPVVIVTLARPRGKNVTAATLVTSGSNAFQTSSPSASRPPV